MPKSETLNLKCKPQTLILGPESGQDGGCICMDGSRVFASSDSPLIKVLDLDTVMFAFCKVLSSVYNCYSNISEVLQVL